MTSGAHPEPYQASTGQPLASLQAPWQQLLLSFATLYTFVLLPVWDSAFVSLPALTAFIISLRAGGWQQLYHNYRPVLILWGILVLFNTALAVMPARAFTGGIHLLRGLVMLMPVLLLVPLAGQQRCLNMLTTILTACAGLALLLVLQVAGSHDTYSALLIIADQHFGNLHNLANLAAIALIASLVLLATLSSLTQRLLLFGCTVSFVWLLLWLRSEGSWLGLACALAVTIMLLCKGWLRWLAASGIASLVCMLHLFYLQPELARQLTGLELPTLLIRAEIYSALLEHWQQAPWAGLGMNSYKYLPVAQVEGIHYLYPHHLYLEALFSLGLAGTALLLALLVALGRHTSLQQLPARPLALIGALVLSYLAVKGMTDMKLFSAQTFSLLVMSVGLMAAPPALSHRSPAQ